MTSTPISEEASVLHPCPCSEYTASIKSLNAIVIQAANRRHYYTGSIFRFCPFCGSPLIPRSEQ